LYTLQNQSQETDQNHLGNAPGPLIKLTTLLNKC